MSTLLQEETHQTGIQLHAGNLDGIYVEFPKPVKVLHLSVDSAREFAGALHRAALVEQRAVLAVAGSIMGKM